MKCHVTMQLQLAPCSILTMTEKPQRMDSLHPEVLPARIKLCTDSSGIFEGLGSDSFDILFVKHTKMAEMFSSGGNRYLLPLCSSLKCSVLYNPHGDMEKALKGYNFDSVSDLMNAKPAPQMIKVCSGHFCSASANVQNDDVLILCGVTKNNGQKVLECTQVETLATKFIREDLDCSFTTNPSSLSMLIDGFASQILPPVTVVFDTLIKSGRRDMYTITNVFTARSVVGSVCDPFHTEEDSVQLIELFLDIPIKYKTVQLPNSEIRALQRNVRKSVQLIGPSILHKIIINSSTYSNDDIQELFLHSIDVNKWESLVQILLPSEETLEEQTSMLSV